MRATREGPLQKTPGEGALRFSSGLLQGPGAREGAGERGQGKVTGNLGVCFSAKRDGGYKKRGLVCAGVSAHREKAHVGLRR